MAWAWLKRFFRREKVARPTMAISGGIIAFEIMLPSGWFLHIFADGGARVGHGSHDEVRLPAGSFSGSNVFLSLSSGTRRGEGAVGDVRITFVEEAYSARTRGTVENREVTHRGDAGVVRDYFEKAIGLVPVEGNRLRELWVKEPAFGVAK